MDKSRSIGTDAGWIPKLFSNNTSRLQTFIKSHSYGEYIFDWSWAEAYERYGVPYYPKLTSMLPFTPVTTPHLFGDISVFEEYESFYKNGAFSSSHFLFLTPNEISFFKKQNYLIRESMQYHFFNEGFENFDSFLQSLKTKKAKNLKSERLFDNLKIKRHTGNSLRRGHADSMYEFYISTIVNKNSFDYLNQSFFREIFHSLKENLLYVEATKNDVPIAGSLFFYDDEKIYGRYWGSKEYIPNLHFELCYYQGIDFCIEHKLKVFEAGAQGEHKIARGFRPVKVYSAHHLKHEAFRQAIEQFIEKEKKIVEENIFELSKYLPFK